MILSAIYSFFDLFHHWVRLSVFHSFGNPFVSTPFLVLRKHSFALFLHYSFHRVFSLVCFNLESVCLTFFLPVYRPVGLRVFLSFLFSILLIFLTTETSDVSSASNLACDAKLSELLI